MFKRSREHVENALEQVYDLGIGHQVQSMNLLQKMASKVIPILAFYVMLMVVAGGCFALLEGKSFWDGFWWANVTATSTGYGDLYPSSIIGRLVGIILMSVSILFIIPILTAKFSAKAIVDSDAWTHQEQEELKGRAKDTLQRVEVIEANISKIMAHLGIEED